jgi:SAM-dependent methyltransferase
MTEPTFEDRRLSFGAAAARYAEHRPGYPTDAIGWMLDGAARPVRDIADVGAGTGAFTRALVGLGYAVTACEPDPGMIAELERALPGIPHLCAPAESLPLDDDSVDAVTAAQAWHWFDAPAAAGEFARVVRPGGVIGLVWNIRDDRVPWMAAMSDLVDDRDSMRSGRTEAFDQIVAVHPGVEHREFVHSVPMSPDALVGLASTFSYVRLREDSDDVLHRLRELLATHPGTAGRASIEVPYVTATYRIAVG